MKKIKTQKKNICSASPRQMKLLPKTTTKKQEETILDFNLPSVDKKWYDISKLPYNSLIKDMIMFLSTSQEQSNKGDKAKAAYYLLVVERYLNEAKLKVTTEV